MTNEIAEFMNSFVPEVKVIYYDLEGKPEEIERYIGFTYPHIGEHIDVCGQLYEVYYVEYFFVNNRPHILICVERVK